ncbi:ABC transporter ATP-binding protein [Afifella sp. JA880]|uniref:ABC transporter ATP-binding protein n=1 Tax=Afifella sp. JA880 TaxID=2975280 RepID=UPI0021BA8DDF|nr:ABC transporter ATP-binding protein [Afifella sp. JA880]MCT8267875.1 ABC transporter ATP-binding protein [Afifella sp. JA880]
MAGMRASGLGKRFGETDALRAVDLAIENGEFLALLGPSGCGKTTLLRLIAGFEVPDAGELHLGDAVVARAGWALPPEERNVGMVFQSYALWPHMSVADNVGFALKVRGLDASECRRRIEEALELVGLAGLSRRKPAELSGGQKQRVALARCLAMQPSVVLLDEPLANLDAHLREAMQIEFRRFHREIGATFVYVTHDQSEAMALADRVAVMDRGALQQVAAPRELYAEPATEMVARFVGRGMVLPVTVLGHENGFIVAEAFGAQMRVRGQATAGEERLLCVRPADLALDGAGMEARVTAAAFQGAATIVSAQIEQGEHVLRLECHGLPPEEGAAVRISVRDGWLLPAGRA